MADKRWLEISMCVDGELAESVADVFSRHCENGAVVESGIECKNSDDPGTPLRTVRVYGFLAIDDQLEDKRQRLLEGLWHLNFIQPLPEPAFRSIEDQDWMAAWKKHYKPIPVGERLMILPTWIEPRDPVRIPIQIDPSMAFGTGTHPTTQLCLAMVETCIRPGQSCIDVGCGSGILSIAALKLGVSHALGVDIESESVKATQRNASANGVLEGLEVGLGSVDDVLNGKFSIRQAPVVLVNILAPIILRLFESGLVKLVEPGGTLILSGILLDQEERIQTAAEQAGLEQIDRAQMKDWVALVYRKP